VAGNAWLVAFGEIEGLRWVLEHERMAFSPGLSRRAAQIQPGDSLVLYVTRGAFHNPTRDRSQIAGLATVMSPVSPLRKPVVIDGREFTMACDLKIDVVLAERQGVPVEPLVRRLSFVKKKDVWGGYFRSGLVQLPVGDFRTITRALGQLRRA
jgi:hypothetical protein